LADIWTNGRPRGQHRQSFPGEQRPTDPAGAAGAEPAGPAGGHPAGDVQQALQMLTLAQRTAEEHVAGARRQAEQILAEARATADQIVRDAQAQADEVRSGADKALSDARARAAKTAEEAEAHAGRARRDGEKIVSDARAQAAEIARNAQASASGLRRQAQQRYDEMVGTLVAKRESLQQQIEALHEFDRDYRNRLLTFMQTQLRALWVEQPQVDGEIEPPPGAPATAVLVPASRSEPEATTGTPPVRTDPPDHT
jgi:vacuolar-type H+-ATPase subunit H